MPARVKRQSGVTHGIPIRIVSWNINSLRVRLERVQALVARHQPDVLCLQETKVTNESFPTLAFMAQGMDVVHHGQAGYNGVATASRLRPEEWRRGFAGDPLGQARVLWTRHGPLWVGNVYVVNGKSTHHPDYGVKLAWLRALAAYVKATFRPEDEVLLVGDWNVAPTDADVWDPQAWSDAILCSGPERDAFGDLVGSLGLVDLHRQVDAGPGPWTWWDYRALAFPKDQGLRIDLALATRSVARRLEGVWVDREERKAGSWQSKPSDHAPLVVDLQY